MPQFRIISENLTNNGWKFGQIQTKQMINLNQIIEPIEQEVIHWVSSYPLTVPIETLIDLTNAQFFLLILQNDKSFRLIQEKHFDHFSQLTFSQRVNRMKLIGRSIIRHYRFEMMKDLSDIHFNYVQMCLEGKDEILRLLIVLMGIIVANQQNLKQIQDYIHQGHSNAYFNIMIDYARKIGEKDITFNESPIKKQKRLIIKLEILEDQIEFYEQHTVQLENKIEKLIEESQKNQNQIIQYERLSKQMITRIQILQNQNEGYSKQISKKIANEQLLNIKLAKNRQLADETVNDLFSEVQKLKQQLRSAHNSLYRYQTVQSLNKQLQQNYSIIHKQKQQIQHKLNKSLQITVKYEQQLSLLQKMYNDMSLQNDNLKLKLSYLQKSFNSRSVYLEPQQKSIVLHHPLNISGVESNQSFNWFKNAEKQSQNERNNQMNDSLTLTIRSASQHFGEAQKQNNINAANLPRIIGQELCFDKIAEQKSFQINIDKINEMMQMKEKQEAEHMFAISMIDTIYQHSLQLKRQLKEYQIKQSKRINRNLQFKNRVDQMFTNK